MLKQKHNLKNIIKLGVFLTLSVFAFLSYTYFTQAQIPDFVNYQGRLRDNTGNPITAPTTIQFSLYSHITNGAPTDIPNSAGPLLWTATYDGSGGCTQITPGTDGIFAQHLGDCVSFPTYLDFTKEYYLGVKIGGDAEASPRVPLSTHPYAFTSKRLHVEGGDLYITNTDVAGNILMNTAGGMEITGTNALFPGAVYNADYSANYTNRSLVDKEYVDNQLMWEIMPASTGGMRIQPKNNSVRQIFVQRDDNSYTQFKVRNNNDAGNGAGAIIELKGSGADYTNNMYIGKYGANFWIPELQNQGAVLTDRNLVIGTASAAQEIHFVTGNSYTDLRPVVVADNEGFRYTSDLSATFVDRTLVDKAYVDSRVGNSIFDADADTGIQVEANPDEDMVRFSTAGTERFLIDNNGRMRLADNPTSFGRSALFEVGIGSESSTFAVSGDPAYLNIATFRDEDGENIFRAQGSLANDDLIVTFGDWDWAYDQLAFGLDAGDDALKLYGGAMRFYEFIGSHIDYVGFKAPNDVTTSTVWTLPGNDGLANYLLQTDGSGNLSWTNPAMINGVNIYNSDGSLTENRIVTMGANNLQFDSAGQTGLLFLDSVNNRIGIGINTPNNLFQVGGLINFDDLTSSTFLGKNAGINNTANYNTFIGFEAGRATTSGRQNVYIGYRAGTANTIGRNSVFIGESAGVMNDTGNANTFIGRKAGENNSSGNENTFIGKEAGRYNTTGGNNTGIGTQALKGNTTGGYNMSLGNNALQNSTNANRNIAIGFSALGGFDHTYNNNIVIGTEAGNLSGDLDGCVMIGDRVGINNTVSNRLMIDNSGTNTPLLDGYFDSDILRVNGTFQINDPTGTGYAFPATDGINGQVLQTDGSGNLSWTSFSGGSGVTASNGLTKTGNDIQLGGLLTADTFINKSGHSMRFNGDGFFQTQVSAGGGQPYYTNVQQELDSYSYFLQRNSDGYRSTFEMTPTYTRFRDDINNKGIEYVADYSANYTNRSLVDKAYVDNNHGTLQQAANASIAADGYVHVDFGATYFEDDGGAGYYAAKTGGFEVGMQDESNGGGIYVKSDTSIGADDGLMYISDGRTTKKGIEYSADYSANYTNRSLVDKEYVDNQISPFDTTANVTSNENDDYANDDFVFGSPSLANDGNDDHDRRFFFDKSKAAFRAGYTPGSEWDDANVGVGSIALGSGYIDGEGSITNAPIASGIRSTAIGIDAVASGNDSFATVGSEAIGSGSFAITNGTANGFNSVAMGGGNANGDHSVAMGGTTTGDHAVSMGLGTTAAAYSVAMGYLSTASGQDSVAMGQNTSASKLGAIAMGLNSIASGDGAIALGKDVFARSYGEVAFGLYNTDYVANNDVDFDPNDRIFVIGNGTGPATVNRSNAFQILKNGTITAPDFSIAEINTAGNTALVTKEYVDSLNTNLWDIDADTGIQVEESADEDMIRFDTAGSQRMIVNNNGYIGVNTENFAHNVATFGSVLPTVNILQSNSTMAGINIDRFSDDDQPARFSLGKARGTESAPTVLQAGDEIMELSGIAYDGGQYISSGGLIVKTDGVPGANNVPTEMTFLTTQSGALGSDEKMVLTSDGKLGIGNLIPSSTLHVESVSGNIADPILTLENGGGDFQVFNVVNSPESDIIGSIGDLAVDNTHGNIYIKGTGTGTNTGWLQLATNSGSSPWTKSGTTLSPTATGDDILLNAGETLSISDLAQGSIPFIGASGLVSQDNNNLFWNDADNRLGIGTTNPNYSLAVVGSGSGTDGTLELATYANAGPPSALYLHRSGGTEATPTAVTNSMPMGGLMTGGYDGTSMVAYSAGMQMDATEDWSNSAHGTRLFFSTTANGTTGMSTKMVIDNNGRVGIGSAITPNALLDVRGNAIFNDDAGDYDFRIEGDTDQNLFFTDAGNNRVGIGTATPSVKLQVNGQTRASSFRSANGTAGSPSYRFDGDTNTGLFRAAADNLAFTTGGSEAMRIDAGGNLGLGVTAPTAQFHTTGTVRFANFGAGTLQTDANGNISVSSDERLKNIQGTFDRGLSELMSINPIEYKWKEKTGYDTESSYYGFSAQNVKLSIPEAVGEDGRGYLTLSDRPILATAINAIKEQQGQIEEFKNDDKVIDDLREALKNIDVDELENRIDDNENLIDEINDSIKNIIDEIKQIWEKVTKNSDDIEELKKENDELKKELCKENDDYSWCDDKENNEDKSSNEENQESQQSVADETDEDASGVEADNNSEVTEETVTEESIEVDDEQMTENQNNNNENNDGGDVNN